MLVQICFLLFLAVSRSDAAVCGTCDAKTNIACLNENQFRQCDGTVQVGPLINCPGETICASGISASCQTPSPLVTADCSTYCSGECSPSDIFVCTGPYSFKSCVGTSSNTVCSAGTICTLNTCEPKTAVNVPLCPNLTPTNPTAPPTDTFCIGKLNQGRYTSSPPDPYCKKYTFCYLNSGVMRSKVYTCPGTTRFDASTGSCISGIPTGCVS
ncbi:hypothetical protein ACFFRR_006297 [Megaselia abdita]